MSVQLMGSIARVESKFYTRIHDGSSNTKVVFNRLDAICPLPDFVKEAERLSRIAGINPATVTKKIPAEELLELFDVTQEAWFKSQNLCLKANEAFGLGEVDPWEDPAVLLTRVHAPDSLKEEVWGLRYMFQLLMEPYARTSGHFTGPGVAVTEYDTRNSLKKNFDSVSSSRFIKFDNWGVWSNPYFNPLRFDDDQTKELSLDRPQRWGFEPAHYSQVAKDTSKNRSIVVGTPCQVSAQRMVDKAIRRVLRMKGIDLETLANFNRLKAFEGSINGNIDTLDLSSASDHISIGLLAYLCRGSRSTERLFMDVMTTRNAIIRTGGVLDEDVEYAAAQLYTYSQGVDGMGNPAIFSLESAIFTAINAWVCLFEPSNSSVDGLCIPSATRGGNLLWKGKTVKWKYFASFGDDQAPPSTVPLELWREIYQRLFMVLNKDKSFGLDDFGHDSMFRESCGADFQSGRLVRGFYLKTREPNLYDALRLYNFFSLYYGLTAKDFDSKLYKKTKRMCVGAWIDKSVFITSNFLFENRIPDNFLIVEGCKGTPCKTLVWHTGARRAWKPFWQKTQSECTAVDLALLACEGQESTVHWYDKCQYRYFALRELNEADWAAYLSSNTRDLAFGRRSSEQDAEDVIMMQEIFLT